MLGGDVPMCVCPKCGKISFLESEDLIVCRNCGYTPICKTNFTRRDELNAHSIGKTSELFNRAREQYTFNSDVFDKDLYQKVVDAEYSTRMAVEAQFQYQRQQTQSQPQIKCPTCGSTSVRRIGSGERAASIFGFGLFSRKARKTFKCNDCGYMW